MAPVNELRNYTLAKQQVTDLIRAAGEFFRARGDTARAEQTHAFLVKLAEDRFNLAVVGQFKRGKSSLMNAVIGRELLPTGLLPLTSAITALCYGPKTRVLLRRKDWSLEQEIEIDELAAYVTERGNPGNEKGVLEARVEIPAPFLRRGLFFIDTPGVGSARAENAATTYQFLPEADAIIFVTSVEAPLSATEEHFLRDIHEYARKLFVVVNKLDLLAPKEREEVLGYIQRGISVASSSAVRDAPAQTLAPDDVRLYPLSARDALAAKAHADEARLEESGLVDLERALAVFLAEEKSRTFLANLLERTQRLLKDSADGDSTALELAAHSEALRASIASGAAFTPSEVEAHAEFPAAAILERAVAANRVEQTAARSRSVLRSGTCPICDAQSRAIFNFFAQWQYALAKDAAARRAFAAARGFCYVHTWQFAQLASPHGISAGYAPLMDDAALELGRIVEHSRGEAAARIQELLPSVEVCPACRVLRETAHDALTQFLAQLTTAQEQQSYAHSAGLCLPHLREALERAPSDELAQFLLREQIQRLEEISEDLRSYTLKRDALRRQLLNEQEQRAWRRALVQLTGERTVRALWSGEAGE